MNVSSYYAGGAGPAVFATDRLYGSPGVHEVDHVHGSGLKFDITSCPTPGYASTHGFDAATLHGYQGQLQQQQQQSTGLGYGPFDAHPAGGKSTLGAGSYPGFNYAPCGQPPSAATYTTPSPLATRYLHDANKFDSIAVTGSDVISQYGGRHFGTAAMMAAAAVATIGGQHHAVGPATCPTLPIYPWMRSMGTGTQLLITSKR